MSYLPPPSTLPPGSIVDSYRRDSGGSRQDKSTDQQLTEIEAFCKRHGLIHRHKFVDDAKSGGSTIARDDFNRMIEEYATPANRPNGLLLWNYARFARDIDDAQFNKIRLRQWGIIIHSFNDQIPEGDYGRVIEFLIDVANEEKRKQTSVDAKRGLKDLVEKYGCMPGTPPRGFKRTPVDLGPRRDKSQHIVHRWEPDPELIPRIKKAFEMKAAGDTLIQIHKETRLYNAINSYRTFFENELYIGILRFGDLTIENYCEPMIDLPTWKVVQTLLTRHSNRQHIHAPNSLHPRRKSELANYLLTGIVYCGRCKSPLWGMSSQQRNGSYYLRYACTKRQRRLECDLQPIPARTLEKEVVKEIIHFFESPQNIRELIELDRQQADQLIEKNKAAAKEIQKEINTLRRSITNITTAISESGHSKALLTKLKLLEEQETDLQSRLQNVKTQTPAVIPPLTENEIGLLSQSLLTRLTSPDPATLRRVLLTTIHSVIIDRNGPRAFGLVNIKRHPRDSKTPAEDNPAITASSITNPAGAPLQTRSIPIEFTIVRKNTKKPCA